MIIVAFTNKTSKILPKLLCRKYKHVAPVLVDKKSMTLIQFVHRKRIVKIKLTWRDIQILKQHGWNFLYLNASTTRQINQSAWTCVQMVKNLLGITNINIQTPYALYKYLSQ
jgi:hypothetical protein